MVAPLAALFYIHTLTLKMVTLNVIVEYAYQ